MRLPITLSLLAAFLVPTLLPGNEPDAWDRLLSGAGLTRETCRYDALDMANFGGHEHLLAYFDAIHKAPLRAPFYARNLRDSVSTSKTMGDLVQLGGLRIDEGTRLNLIGDPLKKIEEKSKFPDAVALAVKAIFTGAGKQTPTLPAAFVKGLELAPKEVRQAAALLLFAEIEALKWRSKAFALVPEADRQRLFAKLVGALPDDDDEIDDELLRLMKRVDLKYLMVGGQLLAMAVDRAAAVLSTYKEGGAFSAVCDTPLGRVVIGSGATRYEAVPYALILDTSGDDLYLGGGGSHDSTRPVSIILDLAGNDRYVESADLVETSVAKYTGRKKKSAHPLFGAGIMGYGILADLSGNDQYRSLSNTQGRGLYGCGVLYDKSGSDRYDCYITGQGSGKFGVGVLADTAGEDEYRCFSTSQGFGDTKGFGLLADSGGSTDLFEANDTVIDFPSPQSPEHNASLSQGCGFGRRADYRDGHSLAGGIGALMDDGGKNRYTAGLFAQGAGYWYGLGLLSSGGGNDTYTGVWYVQASAAHFAVGVLDDTGGDDEYRATMNMAQGAGHDFSSGFLIDHAGNDRHEAPGLSLGGGNANGLGFFWDKAGNDIYVVAPSITLGRANVEDANPNNLRARCITLGLFLDSGGTDTYPAALPWAKNDAAWSMKDSGPGKLPAQRGAGLDAEATGLWEPE